MASASAMLAARPLTLSASAAVAVTAAAGTSASRWPRHSAAMCAGSRGSSRQRVGHSVHGEARAHAEPGAQGEEVVERRAQALVPEVGEALGLALRRRRVERAPGRDGPSLGHGRRCHASARGRRARTRAAGGGGRLRDGQSRSTAGVTSAGAAKLARGAHEAGELGPALALVAAHQGKAPSCSGATSPASPMAMAAPGTRRLGAAAGPDKLGGEYGEPMIGCNRR